MLTYSRYSTDTRKGSAKFFSAWQIGWVLFIGTSAILAILLLVNWLIANEVLRLKNVHVEGLHFMKKKEVLELANLDSTKNVYEFNFGDIEDRIKNHDLVRDAKVSMSLPSTIKIQVLEKEPLALWLNTKLVAIDEFGNLFPELEHQLFHDYPIITNLPLPKDTTDAYHKVVNFLRTVRSQSFALYSEISEISYSENIGIYFFLTEGAIPVFMGEGGISQKGTNLMKVYEILDSENGLANIEYLDLRFEDQVVVKELN
ncbi:FtsQ-type POTRA domain-containing protein [candidate division KSB1 bacterium]|nr:FtsQ-type POTRA domain-containing protein [candidate division KSB1 bacterium]NIR71829.1 FtsQ-type POTRA domain-containing protein [candidate division KSB1 bacterium]NIS25345.1 FtsQ-type POTRA domain-containing protein [candidate division KSB1 bacterium]NIT71815.1 FtsQ-type POTRA domain-containing protein [candidate division KSB1 bacterium]NIU25553.1 FtsQ-type POTRA domain-containing protein [candidate division KSB1 bacterium]